MAKIFSTEKLSLNGDNIRLEASQNGELKILDSDNNVLQSNRTVDSDISSLATASSLEGNRRDSDVSSLANTVTTNDSDLSSLAISDQKHDSDVSSLAISASGSTEQLDSDISSLATASSLEGNRRDSDVSSLALDISTNDVYVNSYQINTTNAPNIDSYVVNYAAAGFTSAPTVVATMMATGVNDPIIGVQLSGNPTTTQATFVFSDDIPGTGYYLEFLASV